MTRTIIAVLLLASACTNSSMGDGVYVLNKEKAKRNITSAKSYVADRGSERILREIDRGELTLILKGDSALFISMDQTPEANGVWHRVTPIESGIKFVMSERQQIIFEKNGSTYLVTIQGIEGTVSLPPQRVEFLKLDQSEAAKYLKSNSNVATKTDQKTSNDLSRWTGTYMYPSGQLLIIDVTNNSISGKTGEGKDGEIRLSDGKVKIDGEEAFLKNDTIFYTMHGVGSSTEIFLVRVLNDMH